MQRDPQRRKLYLQTALADVPRLLTALDRNPYRRTYGCLDRNYWHYRTASFASEMYQEGMLPVALVWSRPLPGNRWYQNSQLREFALAALRFSARNAHRDGSCDDYYPFERALGAAVFSLNAATATYQVLGLDDAEILDGLGRRARWIVQHEESGVLANHHALAAIGLWRLAEISGDSRYCQASQQCLDRVLGWQHAEGWFEEYGGADPGYQTVTIDCLAKYRRATGDGRLDEPIARAVHFARFFLHPDASYGGHYGSRGTRHFYPHGMELLTPENPEAADLADGYLESLACGREAHLDDDRLLAHRTANLIEAYTDWAPRRPAPPAVPEKTAVPFFPGCGLVVRQGTIDQTIISLARGGAFLRSADKRIVVADGGLFVEFADGRVAVSQFHIPSGIAEQTITSGPRNGNEERHDQLSVERNLHWVRFETATPLKQAVFHTGMWLAGRWCRTLVRRILQGRLITGRRTCPARLVRTFIFSDRSQSGREGPALRVIDTIDLLAPGLVVARMAFAGACEAAYVAAAEVYQEAAVLGWHDLSDHVGALNRDRRVTIVRDFD